MGRNPTPSRERDQRDYTCLNTRVETAARVREIARASGLRIDATLAALVRLHDTASTKALTSAGLPRLRPSKASPDAADPSPASARTPVCQHGASLTAPEARAGGSPTREAAV